MTSAVGTPHILGCSRQTAESYRYCFEVRDGSLWFALWLLLLLLFSRRVQFVLFILCWGCFWVGFCFVFGGLSLSLSAFAPLSLPPTPHFFFLYVCGARVEEALYEGKCLFNSLKKTHKKQKTKPTNTLPAIMERIWAKIHFNESGCVRGTYMIYETRAYGNIIEYLGVFLFHLFSSFSGWHSE